MLRAGGVLQRRGAPRSKGAPDGREARYGPTIVTRRAVGVVQRWADDGNGEGRRTRGHRAANGIPVLRRR